MCAENVTYFKTVEGQLSITDCKVVSLYIRSSAADVSRLRLLPIKDYAHTNVVADCPNEETLCNFNWYLKFCTHMLP